jgi:hypothetical protein
MQFPEPMPPCYKRRIIKNAHCGHCCFGAKSPARVWSLDRSTSRMSLLCVFLGLFDFDARLHVELPFVELWIRIRASPLQYAPV